MLAIAFNEANEVDYRLDLLKETDYISTLDHNEIMNDIGERLKLLTKIIKTSKSK